MKSPIEPKIEYAIFEYDHAKDGGAQGDIPLRGGDIPSGCVTGDGQLLVEDAVTSGGAATVALKLVAAADVKAATAIASLGAGDTGTTLAGVATGAVRRVLNATIGAADLTGGKFKVAVPFFRLS